ncbi:hypothetical protein EOS_33810 [Caballeronia mineralivorans PML1(12)]|uniref:HTH gntR-type domain-containing protein n=1 Tax=Caballeronia mineralivorans PML1(12) TaxID=908627 RepID=A0A0J1CM73_9BURK|nr:FCD domain-containing protein [Caballeronia mineralivorans]KLU21822.1 hypothetical protein EOS_33810 [Caballeronia mineralivorans PML1(12)]
MVDSPKTSGQTRLVFEQLRSAIIEGICEPGAKINIASVAEEQKVSPGAVREALAMLEAESWVVSEPARGYRVSPVSQNDLRDLVQARIEVEKLCIAEAIRHGDLAWEGGIVSALHHLSRVPERDRDAPEHLNAQWVLSHSQFHHALVAACPNQWLLRLHRMLYQQSERYRYLSVRVPGGARDVLAEHKGLVDAVLNRDIQAATEKISRHLQETANRLVRVSETPAS